MTTGSIGYVTPADRLNGNHTAIYKQRDQKLKEARLKRAANRNRKREDSNPIQIKKTTQLQLLMD